MNPVLAAPRIVKASADQAEQVALTLAAGFHDDPIFRWLVPDDQRRREVLPPTFLLFAGALMAHDETYVTADGAGAALWMPPGRELIAEDDAEEFGARLIEVCGADAPRMLEIVEVLDEHHPHEPCYFLNFMAVTPEAQGRGVGSGMLEHALDRCDREGVPAYLDATSERNKELYERHGFVAEAEYAADGAPPFFPMWRQPA